MFSTQSGGHQRGVCGGCESSPLSSQKKEKQKLCAFVARIHEHLGCTWIGSHGSAALRLHCGVTQGSCTKQVCMTETGNCWNAALLAGCYFYRNAGP